MRKYKYEDCSEMDSNGYLDRLYVHKDYQGKGISTNKVVRDGVGNKT